MKSKNISSPIKVKTNWALILGCLISGLIIFFAIYGPDIAPKDPMERNVVVQINGEWYTPPVPISSKTFSEFPLGSDANGRDLYSRILFALRPTLTVVLAVATIRLLVGVTFGIIAGWFKNIVGRILEMFISAALAIPILIIALGGIAAVGGDQGEKVFNFFGWIFQLDYAIIAFVVGLSATGWVETARIVRDQTETIRSTQYIEAAFAMGASNLAIIRKHVFRQIYSLIWILFAFEISGTMMLTGALGFMGYYLGGDVWVQVSDYTAEAISGEPELGQMLATSRTHLTQPWGLIAVGSVIFLTVLGFNLLGEGLRLHKADGAGRRSAVSEITAKLTLLIDQYILWPLGNIYRSKPAQIFLKFSYAVILVAGVAWVAIQNIPRSPVSSHLFDKDTPQWSGIGHDSFQTFWSNTKGPSRGEVAWQFEDQSGFSGGPAVNTEGAIIISSNQGFLYTLDQEGEIIWRKKLVHLPVGTPAINIDQSIFIADVEGGLTAYSSDGEIIWHFDSADNNTATSGPIIAPNNNIYYTVGGSIQAVTLTGKSLWKRQILGAGITTDSPYFNPNGTLMFFSGLIVDPLSGEKIAKDLLKNIDEFIVGADGEVYFREENRVYSSTDKSELDINWENATNFTLSFPEKSGVTPDKLVWLFYHTFAPSMGIGNDSRIVWINQIGQIINNVNYPTRGSKIIGVDNLATIYHCGNLDNGYGQSECHAFSPESEKPVWKIKLDNGQTINGGALIEERIYVSTEEGILYAIGTEIPDYNISIAYQEIIKESNRANINLFNHIGPINPTDENFLLLTDLETDLVSNPLVDDAGNIYLTTSRPSLLALFPSGDVKWEYPMVEPSVGDLALKDDTEIFLVSESGNLNVFSTSGEILWRFIPDDVEGVSGVSGVIFDDQDNIYYTQERGINGYIQAVSPQGEFIWRIPIKSFSYFRPPKLSSSQEYIFFDEEVYDAETGGEIEYQFEFNVDSFFGGKNGNDYLVAGNTFTQAFISSSGIILGSQKVIVRHTETFDGTDNIHYYNINENGVFWINSYGYSYWYQSSGDLAGYGSLFPMVGRRTGASFIDTDKDGTQYLCRTNIGDNGTQISCGAAHPDLTVLESEIPDPLWMVSIDIENLEIDRFFRGPSILGTLGKNALYIATIDGKIFVINQPGTAQNIEESSNDLMIGNQQQGPQNREHTTLLSVGSKFTGPMEITNDGRIYLTTNTDLVIYNVQTNQYRQIPLTFNPVGGPIFTAEADLVLVDKNGGLHKLSSEGEILWSYQSDSDTQSYTSPIIDDAGNIYFVASQGSNGILQGVSSKGQIIWKSPIKTGSLGNSPIVTPDGNYVIYKTEIFEATTGALIPHEIHPDIRNFFIGEDNQLYAFSQNSIYQVQITPTEVIQMDSGATTPEFDNAFSSGVTSSGDIWFLQGKDIEWYSPDGNRIAVATLKIPGGNTLIRMVGAIDKEKTAYVCGSQFPLSEAFCAAVSVKEGKTLWWARFAATLLSSDMNNFDMVIINGNIYFSTEIGEIIIIGIEDHPPATQVEIFSITTD